MIILVLLFSTLGLLLWHRRGSNQARFAKSNHSVFISTKRSCPLCSETLERGLRVYSTLFPGKEFDLMHIFGCRYCRNSEKVFISNSVPLKTDSSNTHQKSPRNLNRRRCPCCKGELPKGGYAMARVYQKPYRPPHVHVYGCTLCKPGRR